LLSFFEERNRVGRRHHDVVIAIDDQGRLLNGAWVDLFGAGRQSPHRDGLDLRLDGLVAGRRVQVLLSRRQASQELLTGPLTGARRRKEEEALGMLALRRSFLHGVGQDGRDVADALAAGRPGSG
jgi:hypothetical protein